MRQIELDLTDEELDRVFNSIANLQGFAEESRSYLDGTFDGLGRAMFNEYVLVLLKNKLDNE